MFGDRIVWQRLDLEAENPHATVAAIRHRRPVTYVVSVTKGLQLQASGVPTITVGSAAS